MSLVPDERLSALLLRAEIDDFNADYADKLDRQDLTAWTNCCTEDGFYTVISRENFERSYPVGLSNARCQEAHAGNSMADMGRQQRRSAAVVKGKSSSWG